MRNHFFVALAMCLCASALSAQVSSGISGGSLGGPISQPPRNVAIVPYSTCTTAIAPPTVIATGDSTMPCFQVSITYSGFVAPPPTGKIAWHEFSPSALQSDALCAPSPFRSLTFRSASDCAAYWFDQKRVTFAHAGLDTTQEKTLILWWF